MSGGLLNVILGAIVLVYSWYLPRTLGRMSERSHAKGGDPARIDQLLASRLFRSLLPIAGTLLIAVGIWLLISE
jgi:hypothetical protein